MNNLIYTNNVLVNNLIRNMLRKTLTIDIVETKLEHFVAHIIYLIKMACCNQAKSCKKINVIMNSNLLSNLVLDVFKFFKNFCYYYCEIIRPLLNIFFGILRENKYANKSYLELLDSCKKGNGIMVMLWLIKSPCNPLAYEICKILKKYKFM